MVVPFQVIIDCPFKDITKDGTLSPIDKKYSLCMVNDFEDGKWNVEAFHDFIWDNIAQTALNKKEREALGGRPSTLLKRAAKNLRITDNDVSGGEVAEILLYSIMLMLCMLKRLLVSVECTFKDFHLLSLQKIRSKIDKSVTDLMDVPKGTANNKKLILETCKYSTDIRDLFKDYIEENKDKSER